MPRELDVEAIENKLDNEGFDYYMENYAKSDFSGTELETLYEFFMNSRAVLIQAMIDAGIECD